MNIALLTAGGVGNRMGQDIPKQFMTIDNIPVIIYTMRAFQQHPQIDALAVVCLKGWEVMLQAYANQFVHDGVRPLVSERIISENIDLCQRYGYAVTGMTCKEAIMEKVGDCVENITIPRERLVRTQTPHTYHLGDLLRAHDEAEEKHVENTVASCTLMAALGVEDQHLVIGSEKNGLKLTQTEDVELFKALIHTSKEAWLK